MTIDKLTLPSKDNAVQLKINEIIDNIITDKDFVEKKNERSWTLAIQNANLGNNTWKALAYDGNKLIALSSTGYISTSADGETWATAIQNVDLGDNSWQSLTYGNNKFVALSATGYISTSTNGETWATAIQSAELGSNSWRALAYGGNKFIALGSTGYISTSIDGITWTTAVQDTNLGNYTWKALAYDGNKFVALSQSGYISTSIDGTTWLEATKNTNLGSHSWYAIAYGNSTFIALALSRYVSTSTDGETWAMAAQDTNLGSRSWQSVTYNGSEFIALGQAGYISMSSSLTHILGIENSLNVDFTNNNIFELLNGTTGLIPDARLSNNIARTSDIGNGTITINQGDSQKGTFTLNQTGNVTIDLDAGGGGAVDSVNGYTGVVVLTASDVGAIAPSDLATVATTGDYDDLIDKPIPPVSYGTSSTAAATATKVISIPEITELNVGQVIIVKPSTTSSVANSKIKLNDFEAYNMRYNNANITTSTDSIVWTANVPSLFIFDGTYWQFLGHGLDNNTNTKYASMSVDEGITGTATSTRSLTAAHLKQIIQGTKLKGLVATNDADVVASDSITIGIGKLQAQSTETKSILEDKQNTLNAGTNLEIIRYPVGETTIDGTDSITLSGAKANSLNSVTLYGACSQGFAPTPTNPVDITCNNGVIGWDSTNNVITVTGTTETVTDSLNNIATAEMLLAIGDFKDEQELLSGNVTHKFKVLVLNGTETWTKASAGGFYNTISDIEQSVTGTNTCLCTHFVQAENSTTEMDTFCVRLNHNGFLFNWDSSKTVAQWQAWLAEQYSNGTPVIVIYPLETPTTETVTVQTLNTQSGNNTLTITQASLNNLALSANYEAVGDVINFTGTIGNGTITFTQGGVTKGTITTNQSGNTTIDFDAGGSTITVDSVLSTTSTNPVQNKIITTELNKKIESITSSDVTNALGYTPYNASNPDNFITSADLPTNNVTTDTAQDISGRKTFLGEKAIYFKQQETSNKLGFTLYNPSNTELAALEYRPNTIGSASLLALNCPQTTGGYVGFRYWGTPAVNIVAPKVATAGNYFMATHITNGINTVTADNKGSIDISTLLPDVSGFATQTWVQNQNYITSSALANYVTNTSLATTLQDYQPLLESGTNIKTINNQPILGSGNIDIQGGASMSYDSTTETLTFA